MSLSANVIGAGLAGAEAAWHRIGQEFCKVLSI